MRLVNIKEYMDFLRCIQTFLFLFYQVLFQMRFLKINQRLGLKMFMSQLEIVKEFILIVELKNVQLLERSF